MFLLPLLAFVGSIGAASPTRTLDAWIGSDPVRLQAVHVRSVPGALLLTDSVIRLEWRTGSGIRDADSLVGPVRLVRRGKKTWQVPEGSVVRRAPPHWNLPAPPPLVVSGDSLCHWGPVVARLAFQDRPASWDSVCFDHAGQVRTARLLSRWEEWHPWISLRVERDSGHRMRGPVFVAPPDRMVLEPDPSFARESGMGHGYEHGFRWLDDSGSPLRARRILSWSDLDDMPCLRARAGRLDAGVRPRFSALYRPVCWLTLPGSGDTLVDFETGTGAVSHPGWRMDGSTVPARDGWTLESAPMRLTNVLGSTGLQYEIDPESFRWRRGASVWALRLPDPHGPWLRPSVPPDSIPPLQDPDVSWDVETTPPLSGELPVPGFGIARWANRLRWRTPDSLVVVATLHLEGRGRKLLHRDSVGIELAARWDSQGVTVDRSGGFRTQPQVGMELGPGAVVTGTRGYGARGGDRCPTFVLEHDARGDRVLALCPPETGATGLLFLEKGQVRTVVDGNLDTQFRPGLGAPAILGSGPKQQPRVRRHPARGGEALQRSGSSIGLPP